ncbi:CopZ family metallochaperone [Pirellulaceae bacterium SH449]
MTNNPRFRVDGMTCQHCKAAVEKALLEVPGVDHVEVDLRQGTAAVQGAPNAEKAIRAIMNEGFDARLLETHAN